VTARIDQVVKASRPLRVSGLPAPGAQNSKAHTPEEAEKRRRRHDERVARWQAITEAGGSKAWIEDQLRKKGLTFEGVDPSQLSDREKAQYKAKRKQEAEERRLLKRQAWEAYHATHIVHLGPGVHWEDDPDRDRFDLENREQRARDNGLPDLKGAEELAKALGLPVARLRWLAYHREVERSTHYAYFTIPKRDGTPRPISAPKPDLKAAQRWVLREVAEKLPVHSAAHGFLPARSILTNARLHAGADTIVKLDIEGFFPTITWRRVKGLLRKAGLTESVATVVSLLCTEPPRQEVSFRGQTLHVATGPRVLPQGAPTSPALTNAICLRLDRRLSGLARTLGFRYTRYADDLTFSWHRPAEAREGDHPRAPVGALLRGARAILTSEGFTLNGNKTRVLKAGDRQKVTGLVVNRADGVPPARVPREVLRRLRAALHNREQGRPGKAGETLEQLRGLAAFVHMTDPVRGRALLDRIAKLSG
jgi:hypothetical protein